MATILYARVSTADQTLDHQRIQAELAGFKFDQVIADHGVSGVTKALRERPEGRRLFDMLRAGDTLVVRWVDRLGRNYQDVTDNIREFIRRGLTVRTVINGLVFDGTTTDPMQAAVRDALIAGWLAAEPQLTAIAIVGRLAERHPEQFGKKQHSIVQRLLRALRQGAAQRLIAETATARCENVAQRPGAVDGSGYRGPDPPTAPLPVPALNVDPSANVLRPPAW